MHSGQQQHEEPSLRGALAAAVLDDADEASAVHRGERLAWAMARELSPAVSLSRVPIAPLWLEPWAACQPLQGASPQRLVRTATIVRTATGLVCIDPCVPSAWSRSPHGERMRALHDTHETFPLTLLAAVGRPEHFTEVIFTSLYAQSLHELLGAHAEGLEAAIAPFFPRAKIVLGAGALRRPRSALERATDVRDGLSRPLRTDDVLEVAAPTLLPSGLVVIPTRGHSPEQLEVAFVQSLERPRVAVVSGQLTTREALSPYESALPGLREHARLRDAAVAVRGDAADHEGHRRALSFVRALADRDPADPRFHLVHPSLALS